MLKMLTASTNVKIKLSFLMPNQFCTLREKNREKKVTIAVMVKNNPILPKSKIRAKDVKKLLTAP